MAEIDYNNKGELVCSLDASECALLKDDVFAMIVRADKKVEHYEDLCMDGYGTENQTTLLEKWRERAAMLRTIHRSLLDVSKSI